MSPTQIRQFRNRTEDALATEERSFERQRAQLLRRYPGQFVAIYGGRVVAHHKNAEKLAARLFAELGDVPFFIARVEKKPSVYDLPSPDLGE
jgi:hypothetical protein